MKLNRLLPGSVCEKKIMHVQSSYEISAKCMNNAMESRNTASYFTFFVRKRADTLLGNHNAHKKLDVKKMKGKICDTAQLRNLITPPDQCIQPHSQTPGSEAIYMCTVKPHACHSTCTLARYVSMYVFLDPIVNVYQPSA